MSRPVSARMRHVAMPRGEAAALVEFVLDVGTRPDAAPGITDAAERVLVALRANRYAIGWSRDQLDGDEAAQFVLDEAAALLHRWAWTRTPPGL